MFNLSSQVRKVWRQYERMRSESPFMAQGMAESFFRNVLSDPESPASEKKLARKYMEMLRDA